MQASNLGVVFGPTLIRAEVETVAKINNIKYQNIIVEMMIDEKDKVICMCMCVCIFCVCLYTVEFLNNEHFWTSFFGCYIEVAQLVVLIKR